MEPNFSNNRNRSNEEVMVENHEILKKEQFHYLVSIITKDGELGEDVTHRIKVG